MPYIMGDSDYASSVDMSKLTPNQQQRLLALLDAVAKYMAKKDAKAKLEAQRKARPETIEEKLIT